MLGVSAEKGYRIEIEQKEEAGNGLNVLKVVYVVAIVIIIVVVAVDFTLKLGRHSKI